MMKRGLLAVLFTALSSGFFMPAYGAGSAGNQPAGQPVQGVAINRATVNSSLTVTTAGTFYQALASNLNTSTQRQSLTIQNNNTNTDACWVFIGPIASATKAISINLAVGQAYTRYWPYVPSDQISVTCAGNGDTVYVDAQ